ncbi:MAG: cytochrome c biogenesis protein CcsA [Prevotella sp.]|nr:cytochrome c biogenesis protein CcsA [Prevotella sp.]
MIWDKFIFFALSSLLLWAVGALLAWKDRHRPAIVLTCAGLAIFFGYILLLWHVLQRPPMRTMGETRLWYSFFLPLSGVIVYLRWRYKWILTFSATLAAVFIMINILKPEIHSKSLMPALQSPWFAPHVIVYMLAYAMMGAAFVLTLYLLLRKGGKKEDWAREMAITDDLVAVSYAFLTLGMLMGALWAKEAWGHYWSWDPKETWAAITWFSYLTFIHFRKTEPQKHKAALCFIILTFGLLQMCWWGVNYLPSAQGSSIHTYSMQ